VILPLLMVFAASGVATWLPLGIAGVAFLGTGAVYLRGSADKGTIESQDRLIKAQGAEIANLTVRVATAEAKVTAVEAENNALRRSVAHVEELVTLQQTLDEHEAKANTRHSDQMTAIRSLASAVESA